MQQEESLFKRDISPVSEKGNLFLIVANIVLFILSDFFEIKIKGEYLLDAGDISWVSVLQEGEYYRIISSMFLHVDSEHIFNNMLTLAFLGSYLESYMGTLRYLIIYFCSGIVAGCSSMVYNMILGSTVPSVGASGAVFGVMGGVLCMIIMNRNLVYKSDINRIIFMAFLSLYCGFASAGVDNAAHVGGIAGGFFITGVFIFLMKMNRKQES